MRKKGIAGAFILIIQILVLTACLLPGVVGDQSTRKTATAAFIKSEVARLVALTLTPVAEVTDLPVQILTGSPTYTPLVPLVTVSQETICRAGPGTQYSQVSVLRPGDMAVVLGRDSNGSYWIIHDPHGHGTCWLGIQNAALAGNPQLLPVYVTPSTPTTTPTATVTRTFTPSPTTRSPAFIVSGVIVSVDPAFYSGACPKNFNFSVAITVNNPGTVTYRWERSDGLSSPVQQLVFGAPGAQTVSTGWPRDASGDYWVRVHILTPNDVISNQASFRLDCTAFAVTGVTASVEPLTYQGTCPKNFTFSSVITTNLPGVVTYRWERSDGLSSPLQSLSFVAAGSQTVSTGWPREASGNYWVKVHVLSPNDRFSNQAGFSLSCFDFTVTDASVTVNDPIFSAPCTYRITWDGSIKANGAGIVKYEWETKSGAFPYSGTGIRTHTFPETGTLNTSTWYENTGSAVITARLHIIEPDSFYSNIRSMEISCP